MHTVRNRTAMSRTGGEFRHVSKAGMKLPSSPSPAFPEQVCIPPRKGVVIRDAPLPEPQARAEAALILPAPELPPLPGATHAPTIKPPGKLSGKAVGKRGQTTRRRKTAKFTALPKRGKAKAPAAKAPPQVLPQSPALTIPLSQPVPVRAPAIAPIAPIALPRSRSLVDTRKPGMVARVVFWLDALSRALVGQRLSRTVRKKSRILPLPAPRQSIARTTAGQRAPPSRQPAPTGGGAGDELSFLRAENARLKAELAMLGR
ncbi:hypothetical protein [Novosphingobium sp.]|uniref:hypothetical protein n=1 Tax=Novosphingobium sp. TaxID=1874826 RepID=UPI00286DA96F|nr:hypothetical protein [Novosphingobium sp.]